MSRRPAVRGHDRPAVVPHVSLIGPGVDHRFDRDGHAIAIEPMVNAGTYQVYMRDNGWTVVTADGRPSAHYENTVAITEDGVEILSL